MNSKNDEALIINYNERLTGHATHVARSHRKPPPFSMRASVGMVLVMSVMATFLTADIIESSRAEPVAKLHATLLAPQVGSPFSEPSTGHVGPPLLPPEPGPAMFVAVSVQVKHIAPAPTAPPAPQAVAVSKIQIVISYALHQQGKPYVWGAAGPNSFDCSGLVLAAYAQIGIHMYHFTGAMMGLGSKVSRAAMQPGDLIFPSGSHVGIYLGNNKMVVAPHPGARVQIQTVYAFYTARHITTG